MLGHGIHIKEAFEQVQKTFRWKLLLDVIAITVSLLNKMAWISVYLLNPGDVEVYSMWSGLQPCSALYLHFDLFVLRVDRLGFASLSSACGELRDEM